MTRLEMARGHVAWALDWSAPDIESVSLVSSRQSPCSDVTGPRPLRRPLNLFPLLSVSKASNRSLLFRVQKGTQPPCRALLPDGGISHQAGVESERKLNVDPASNPWNRIGFQPRVGLLFLLLPGNVDSPPRAQLRPNFKQSCGGDDAPSNAPRTWQS